MLFYEDQNLSFVISEDLKMLIKIFFRISRLIKDSQRNVNSYWLVFEHSLSSEILLLEEIWV